MELLKIEDHFLISDFVSNGSFASLKENVQYKQNPDYAILVRITDFVKKWNGDYIYINKEEYNFLKKSKVFPGDLIISNVGQPGLSYILPELGINTSLAPNSIFLRPKTKRVNNLYLSYFLKTPQGQRIIDSICTKTTLKKFNKTSFRKLSLPFPSYQDQIKVTELLSKIETLIAERKESLKLLDELIEATFYQMFDEPRKIKPSELKTLDQVCLQITDGEHTTPKRTDKGIKLLSARNIRNGYLDFKKGVDYIDHDEYQRISKRCKPELMDVLMSCSGSVGRVAVINTDEPFSLVRSVALIKPNHKLINSYYLMYWLRSQFLQSEIRRNSKKSSQANIFTGAIKNLPIYLADLDLQVQFATIAQKIESIKVEQEAHVLVMDELYSSINQQAFSGELDLSGLPFDAMLLHRDDKIAANDNQITRLNEEGFPKVIRKEVPKILDAVKKAGNLAWDTISFKEVAEYIKNNFQHYYFNSEMLLRYLSEDLGIFVNYFSSAEQKKNPQYENADDFFKFISGALIGQNTFLHIEQVFYNAEEDNIPNISFTMADLERLTKKDKKERSGIYFRIQDEVIAH